MECYILPRFADALHSQKEKRKYMEAHAECWRPYRSVASLYLCKGG
jgi:3-methyladenine DNA glycosylase/8-oxoguanine DNA glycosylase